MCAEVVGVNDDKRCQPGKLHEPPDRMENLYKRNSETVSERNASITHKCTDAGSDDEI